MLSYVFIENIKGHGTSAAKCALFGNNINCKRYRFILVLVDILMST